MRRWVPTWFLIVTILTTASGQREVAPNPCTPPLLSQVLVSTINYRNGWPDQTIQRFSEQVLQANPLFASQDTTSLLVWHIAPRDNGCVVSATVWGSGIPVTGNTFYVDLETGLVLPDDQDTNFYINMITADPIVLVSAASQ